MLGFLVSWGFPLLEKERCLRVGEEEEAEGEEGFREDGHGWFLALVWEGVLWRWMSNWGRFWRCGSLGDGYQGFLF
jgi:hypothetical protein